MSWGSYGLNLGLRPVTRDGPLYAAMAASVHPLGGEQVLVRERDTGRTAVLTSDVLRALDLCREFAPLEHHVQRICQQLSRLQGQESTVQSVLEDLARRGLLKRADEWLDALRGADANAEVQAPFRTLIIRTCERPQALAALLGSLGEYERRWGAHHRYVVVDMSRDPELVQCNREAMAAFQARSGCRVAHVDRARQKRYLDELSQALPEHAQGLAYLLGDNGGELGYHGDYGVSLNWMHVLGAGERYALLDDDHLFPLRWHPEWGRGLDLQDGSETPRLFADLDDALAWGLEPESDPLAAHAGICGLTLAEALCSGPTRIEANALRGLCPAALPHLDPQSRVLASSHGHRGDTCSMSPMWLLSLPAAARPAALANPERYQKAMARPAVAQASTRYRRLDVSGLTPFMVDGSRLLPAVPPRGRGEDGVFCALLGTLHRDGMLLELPLSIGHSRPSAPDRSGFTERPFSPALSQVLTDRLRLVASDLQSADPLARLRVTCAQLEEQAAVTDLEAAHYLQDYLSSFRAGWLANLRHVLNQAPVAPAHWAKDLNSFIEVNARALLDNVPAQFAEWPAETDSLHGGQLWRAYLGRFAKALRGWPDAVDVARARASHWIEED